MDTIRPDCQHKSNPYEKTQPQQPQAHPRNGQKKRRHAHSGRIASLWTASVDPDYSQCATPLDSALCGTQITLIPQPTTVRQARQSGPVMDGADSAAWSRLPAQDALAPKNLYVRVSIQLTADRSSQLCCRSTSTVVGYCETSEGRRSTCLIAASELRPCHRWSAMQGGLCYSWSQNQIS